jgi:hypothetical protein
MIFMDMICSFSWPKAQSNCFVLLRTLCQYVKFKRYQNVKISVSYM